MNLSFNNAYLAIAFLLIGAFGSVLSLEPFLYLPYERLIWKGLAFSSFFAVFIFMSLKRQYIKMNEFILLFIILLPYVALCFSNLILDFANSVNTVLRFFGALFLALSLFLFTKHELKILLKWSLLVVAMFSILSIVFFLTQIIGYEKFPILNMYSNKSIIFEQNVFGIMVYLASVIILSKKINIYRLSGLAANIFATFISFYRTVYGLIILYLMYRLPHWLKFILLVILVFIVYALWDLLYDVLKLEQVSSLTGRSDLWTIGLSGFSESPILGLAETTIPDYSNNILNRHQAYTTYHNIFIDVVYSTGSVGLVALLCHYLVLYALVGVENWVSLSFILAPSLFNSYLVFAPNAIGFICAVWIILAFREGKIA